MTFDTIEIVIINNAGVAVQICQQVHEPLHTILHAKPSVFFLVVRMRGEREGKIRLGRCARCKYLLSRASEESTEATQLLGYTELRVNQALVMTYILSGRNVFVSLLSVVESLCATVWSQLSLQRTSWYG